MAFSQEPGTIDTLSRVAGKPMEKVVSFSCQDSEFCTQKITVTGERKTFRKGRPIEENPNSVGLIPG